MVYYNLKEGKLFKNCFSLGKVFVFAIALIFVASSEAAVKDLLGDYKIDNQNLEGTLRVNKIQDNNILFKISTSSKPQGYAADIEGTATLKNTIAFFRGENNCQLKIDFQQDKAIVSGGDNTCRYYMGAGGGIDGTYIRIGKASGKNSDNLKKYIGKYADKKFYNLPVIKESTKKLFGKEYSHVIRNLTVHSPIEVEGDNLIIAGCAPHDCGTEEAIMSINMNTGEVTAAMLSTSMVQVPGKYPEIGGQSITVFSKVKKIDQLPLAISNWIKDRNQPTTKIKYYQ